MAMNNPYPENKQMQNPKIYKMQKQVNLNQESYQEKTKSTAQNGPKQANPYLQSQVMTASPQELVVMLYDGAIRFINQAVAAIEKKDMEKAHHFNMRAQNIFLELMNGLDQEYEISDELFKMYEFIHYHLIAANSEKSIEKLKETVNLTREMRDTWKQAMESVKSS
ncbi:flagellar export chaperone FliS [Tindallia californiensis]|uniref:Flagellar protein FliS n=1 Tax=Tindallia californiensis TaxID=159292 RepID=A0A1H3LBC7_9FIRM|nr:flagellar export chaperone FliS [Tindallia californiensis]SDY61218.1 flagellar protein FliS [Tindallia californiensis]